MESRIPEHHPLRKLFGALAERAFTEKLGWPDFNVSDYISKLLVEFTRTDHLYRIKSAKGEQLEAVVDLLYESEVTHGSRSFEREREVHRHIGDFTLFMAGAFPADLNRVHNPRPPSPNQLLFGLPKNSQTTHPARGRGTPGQPPAAQEGAP